MDYARETARDDESIAEYYDTYWRRGEGHPLTGLYAELRALLAANVEPAFRCLDVGCGDGRTVGAFLDHMAASYTGVDVASAAVQEAQRLGLDARVIADPGDLPFPDSCFDLATCLEVLEHLVAPLTAAREIRRVLRPGGRLIATVPNVVYWRRRLDFVAIGRWNPLGDHLSLQEPWRDPHLRFFNLRAFRHMLEEAGFEVVSAGGHWGGFLVDLPGRHRFGDRGSIADIDRMRPASRAYRRLEAMFPGLLAFRLHVIAKRPDACR
jgi:methionine biosynthesis protein MetW